MVADEGVDIDVPLAGVAVLEETTEVCEFVLLEDGEIPVLVERVAMLADLEVGTKVAPLAPDVVEAVILPGIELTPLVGARVELPAPPVTVTVTVTVTVVVEVEGVAVTVTVTGVGVTVTVTALLFEDVAITVGLIVTVSVTSEGEGVTVTV